MAVINTKKHKIIFSIYNINIYDYIYHDYSLHMAKTSFILCLIQEINYLKQYILNHPQLHYVGESQFESNRPFASKPEYVYI